MNLTRELAAVVAVRLGLAPGAVWQPPAQPNYLAVWLPGMGTLWVDDLGLREVVLPAAGALHD